SVDPANPTVLLPVGTQRTNGLEASLGGEIADGWRIRVGYAHLDGRITGSTPGTKVSGVAIEGHRPSLTPVDSGNLWITWDITEGWGAGLGINASGDRFASNSNLVRLGSYTTVDGAVYYRARRWDLSLNLKNLTNQKYIAAGHGASDLLLVPGTPVSADLSLRFRL
ncbi:MAG: ferric malleobactin transporter, partial [Holophagaceae bacterium]|nr:ferric malleobactin transporter [Holophagaceae bacterium]